MIEGVHTQCLVWKAGSTHVITIPINIRNGLDIKEGDIIDIAFGTILSRGNTRKKVKKEDGLPNING